MGNSGATFAAVFAALYAAHMVADHWVQTGYQAIHKGDIGRDSRRGRLAALRHVATYTLVALLAVLVAWWRLGLALDVPHVLAGILVSAGSHWWADRRWTLAMVGRWLRKEDFAALGGPLGGAYLLDQSWHIGWLFVAALVMA